MSLERSTLLWSASFATWAFLLWHGGLHAWQAPIAGFGLVIALGAWRSSPWTRTGTAACAFILLAALGLPSSLRPQHTLDLLALLGVLTLLLGTLRHSPSPWPDLWPKLVVATGVLASLGFLGLGLFKGQGGLAPAHLAARPLFPNQNLISGGLVLPAFLIFAARSTMGRIQWAGLAVTLAALCYSGSKGVALAVALSLLWVSVRSKRLAPLWLLLIFALGQSLLPLNTALKRSTEPGASGQRWVFWQESLRTSLERPWLGHGLGSFSLAAQRMDLPVPPATGQAMRYRLTLDHPHSEPLALAVEAGWPAAFLACLAALAWLWSRWGHSSRSPESLGLEAGLVGALVLGLTDMPWRTPALLMGALLSYAWLEPRSPTASPAAPRRSLRVLLAVVLLSSSLGWYWRETVRRRELAGKSVPLLADASALLRPLDGGLAVWRAPEGWPWGPWSARFEPQWWSEAAQRQADPALAEQAWSRALQLRPYYIPYWHGRIATALAAGEHEHALLWSEHALQLEPDDAVALVLRYKACQASGDLKGMSACLQELRRIEALLPSMDPADALNRALLSVDWDWVHAQTKLLSKRLH